ncbi:RimJ/RimL family protein N-acetyltransferase [Sphingomonas endophytica]|uniref:RimJ/RimL family protein N-acetyltransferase n=1 Tax=Sphingomonas endophytica TaxID=869719 RepID=A0A7X0JFA7_9SPHN|nr:GNAT family N-acetyltransferase [Sphingomonas endophytica]MBB6505587.1 RimJ/RimL family protein N-acetyltransferase [Sphingomonas endophytica]
MIGTERLILRAWRAADVAPFHAMGQDAEVMRYLGPETTIAGAGAMLHEANETARTFGRCFWAMERRADRAFIGFCGVEPGPAGSPIAGLPEIGWRLARSAWGQGLATEAARAVLAAEWERGTETVYAITVPANRRSWGLMERLGMTRVEDGDFDHPDLAPDSPLRRHVLYRIDHPLNG